jgi:hypothetical protein
MRLDLLGYDSFGEYSSDFFLAGNDWNRGGTEIAGPPLPTFIFENCWPMRSAGRIGLLPIGGVPP